MIEFQGYISGNAEKHFLKRTRDLTINIVLVGSLLAIPWFFMIISLTNNLSFLVLYLLIILLLVSFLYIPRSKKFIKTIKPNRIYINEDSVVCVAEKYTDSKLLSDVKYVRDFDEFYEIVFRMGKKSEKYICQKSLISKGSVEEFERLFEGRIVKEVTKK